MIEAEYQLLRQGLTDALRKARIHRLGIDDAMRHLDLFYYANLAFPASPTAADQDYSDRKPADPDRPEPTYCEDAHER